MTKEKLKQEAEENYFSEENIISMSDLNKEENQKYICHEAQPVAIYLQKDRLAPTMCLLERAYVFGRRVSEKYIAELEERISVLLSCKNCPENKGGLICQKEYENKCLAQKIQFIKELQEENNDLKNKTVLSIDCDKAEKHGELCLGYGGDEDEPCEQCKNCIKCETGYYQLGETEKDEQLNKLQEENEGLRADVQNRPNVEAENIELKNQIADLKDYVLKVSKFLHNNNNVRPEHLVYKERDMLLIKELKLFEKWETKEK